MIHASGPRHARSTHTNYRPGTKGYHYKLAQSVGFCMEEHQQPQMEPQIQALGQAVQGLQQQMARMQQTPPRMNLKVPGFEGQSSQEYKRWARAAQIVCTGNQYTLGQTVAAVLSAMTGRASDITSTLSADPASYANQEGFFAQLKSLFVTPAFQEVARAQFQSRVQGPQEPIRVYHAMLHKLWIDAYSQEEEPWRTDPNLPLPPGAQLADPPGHQSRCLIEAFMQGLRQCQVRIKIWDSITYWMAICTYEEVLVRALAFLSNQDKKGNTCSMVPPAEVISRGISQAPQRVVGN